MATLREQLWKRLRPHLSWFLFSVGMFLIGSWLAPVSNEHNESTQAKTYVSMPSEDRPSGMATPGKDLPLSKLTRASNPIHGASIWSTAPLTEEQIEALAITATKSRNPVERRRAFDRLLQEMRLATFSKAQVMAMRSSLHEHGAVRVWGHDASQVFWKILIVLVVVLRWSKVENITTCRLWTAVCVAQKHGSLPSLCQC